MITLILPGYSRHNKDWAMNIAESLEVDGEIRPILWKHWSEEGEAHPFSAQDKVEGLQNLVKSEEVNIIAKSIGTYVAIGLMAKIPSQIKKVILCGIPLNDISDENKKLYQDVLSNFPGEKVVCFQNENDPLGTYPEVEKFLGSINPKIKIVKKSRDDHEYPYNEDFQAFLV